MRFFIKVLFSALLLFFITYGKAQSLKEVYHNKYSGFIYLGIDFSKCKLLDKGNPDDIKGRLYDEINQVILSENKKYNIAKSFNKLEIDYDISSVIKHNSRIKIDDIISFASSDFNRLTEADIVATVNELNFNGKKGIGLVFIVEAMKKSDEQSKMATWVTFIEMESNKILMTERVVSEVKGGFGFRNYWASGIKNLIDKIEEKKYDEWKRKY